MSSGLKIVRLNGDQPYLLSDGTGAIGSGVGGDLSGTLPAPTVTGIDGIAISGSPALNNLIQYNGTNWVFVAPSALGVGIDVTDGTTTVNPATTETLPKGGVTNLGAGNAGLNVLTSVYGGQAKTVTLAGVTGATSLDLSAGNVFDLTLSGNTTLSFTNPPPSGVRGEWDFVIRQGGSGSYTVTWPIAVVWPDTTSGLPTGSAPTLHTAVGAQDDVKLTTFNGGTSYGGSYDVSGSSGTVTSVGLTMPAEFSVTGSPVTTSGTLAVAKANESANTVWAGPTSGAAAAPTFRALVAADIPAGVGTTDHAHVDNVLFSGDGATTDFVLPAAPFDAYSVSVFVANSRSQDWTLTGALLDTLHFGSAPASATDNIAVDIVAATS